MPPTTPTAPEKGANSALSEQLGLGEKQGSAQGSTEQADQFKAAFQAVIGGVNQCLQYTAAHAEQGKHDPLSAKREKSCQAFQVALGKIDPTNKATAQAAIDQVLTAVKGLQSTVVATKQAVEKAFTAWTAKQSTFDELGDKVREMVEWRHVKATKLQEVVATIAQMANLRKYEEAVGALEQIGLKIGPIFEEYQRQRQAQEEYDVLLPNVEPNLAEALTCEFAGLEGASAAIAETEAAMRAAAESRDFVTALAKLQNLEQLITDYLDQLAELRAQREQYEQARAALDPKLTEASSCQYGALATLDQEIADLTSRLDEAAAAEDYEQALTRVQELSEKVDEKLARVAEIDAKRDEYHQARTALDPRLAEASTSQYEALQELDQELADLTTRTDEAAAAEDFEQAVVLVHELSAKVDEKLACVAQLDALKVEYEQRLAALQPDLTEASVSEERTAYAAPIQAEMARIQTEMEAAATAQDFESAVALLGDLEAKVAEFFAAIEAKKQAYEAARAAALTPLGECRLAVNSFPSLNAKLVALQPLQQAMQASEDAGDYVQGITDAQALQKAAAAYLVEATALAKKSQDQADALTKELDAESGVARKEKAREWANKLTPDELVALPTNTRNRLMEELHEGGLDDEDKEALHEIYKVPTLDADYEREMIKTRAEFIEKLQNDPEMAEARKNWGTMSPDKRLDVLRKAAKVHAKTFDHEKIEGVPDLTLKDNPVTDRNSNGVYDPNTGEIGINTVKKTDSGHVPKFNDFDLSMNLIAHEAGHRHQQMLAEKVNKTPPDIKPGDPMYEQARSFAINDKYYASYKEKYGSGPETTPYNVYKNQPQEAASRRSGAALHSAEIGKDDDHDHDHDHEH